MLKSKLKERLSITLRSLHHRNYRLFFCGQGVSLIGTWMQSIATGWLVYRITNSTFMLGLVAFSGQLPSFIISPFAGVLGDKGISRRKIILTTQIISMLQAAILAYLTLKGLIQIWQIFVLSFTLGLANSFEMPSRQAFVIEIIDDKSDLGNAIALNSSLFNASRLIGPALAGILVAITGEGICFVINSASYLASIAALVLMRLPVAAYQKLESKFLHKLKEGIQYSIRFTPIRDLLITISMISMVAMSFPVLMPVFAKKVLHGGSHTYGFLVASSGMGALFGTIYLAMRKTILGLGRVISILIPLFGLSLLVFSFSRALPVSMITLAITGFSMITVIASCNTIVQTIVDEDKRGRVMSFYVMAFMGSAPLGSYLTGTIARYVGAPHTILISAIFSMLIGLMFIIRLPVLRKRIRPVYSKMGIIPEVAVGMQTADELRKPLNQLGTILITIVLHLFSVL